MNPHYKYKAFLNELRESTDYANILESIEKAYDIIFEAGNATDIDEENANYTLKDIYKKQSGLPAYGAHKQRNKIHGDLSQKGFTNADAMKKADVRAKLEESLLIPSREDVDDIGELISHYASASQYDIPENIQTRIMNLVKGTSRKQIDAVGKYIEESYKRNSGDMVPFIKDILEDLTDKAKWASEQRAALQQAGEAHVAYDVADIDDEFGTLFTRGANYEDMLDMIAREGAAKIGAERSLTLPKSVIQAARSKGLSESEIKHLNGMHKEIISAISKTQQSLIQYIWGKVKTNASVVNQEIASAISAKNTEVKTAINNEMKAKGRTPELEQKWEEATANAIRWPYQGRGLHQTMFKELIGGVDNERTAAAKQALSSIGMDINSVVAKVAGGLNSDNAEQYLKQFLKKYKDAKLNGLDNDNPGVLAVSAMEQDNTDAIEIYTGIINALKPMMDKVA